MHYVGEDNKTYYYHHDRINTINPVNLYFKELLVGNYVVT